jgi:hypothetical protein
MNFFTFILLVVLLAGAAACKFLVQQSVGLIVPLWIRWQVWSKLDPTFNFTPWLFEPIAVADLPRHHRLFFEVHTSAFVRLGFKPLGDFVLRRDPAPSCSRYFLSPCGTIIEALSHYLDEKCISCTSITLSGLYLESGNSPIDDLPPIEHGLQFFVLRTNDPAAMVEFHRRSAGHLASQRGTALAPIEADEVPTVLNHGRELSLNSLHQQGVLPMINLRSTARQPAASKPR